VNRHRPSVRRLPLRGLTLLEILIVLALLVVLAAVTMPALSGTLRKQRLVSAAEEVRAEWMRAHIKAMKTGRIHVFRFQVGERHYEVAPWVAADDAIEAAPSAASPIAGFSSASTAAGDSAASAPDDDLGPGLPEGIIFVGGDVQADSRALAIEEIMSAAPAVGTTQWGPPILFYPDGTSSDAFVVVANEQSEAVRVDLRGLTGLATVGEVTLLEELVQ
jgi:prepilin-type N-terminal cleavage/methylation domain-containing protein